MRHNTNSDVATVERAWLPVVPPSNELESIDQDTRNCPVGNYMKFMKGVSKKVILGIKSEERPCTPGIVRTPECTQSAGINSRRGKCCQTSIYFFKDIRFFLAILIHKEIPVRSACLCTGLITFSFILSSLTLRTPSSQPWAGYTMPRPRCRLHHSTLSSSEYVWVLPPS